MRLLLLLLITTTLGYTQSLNLLFAEPTETEKTAVLAEWESRDTAVYGWQVEDGYTTGGANDSVEIVSHLVRGNRHYGGVRLPRNYNPAQSYPILISNHGGMEGIPNFDGSLGAFSSGDYTGYFIVMPSFCGEMINSANGKSYISEGGKSEFDIDIDNAIALVNGVIANYTGATVHNMMVTGGSRGGGVSYLMMARDTRIERAVVFYGGVDHMTLPGLKEDIEANLNSPFYATVKSFSTPYMSGSMSLEDARFGLLQRSAIHFLDRFPPNIQVHHGDADAAVTVKNSQYLDSVVQADYPSISLDYYEYPSVAHTTTPDMISLRKEFLVAQPITSILRSERIDIPSVTMMFSEGVLQISAVDGGGTVELIRANGQLAQRISCASQSSLQISLKSLTPGIYLVRVITNDVVLGVQALRL